MWLEAPASSSSGSASPGNQSPNRLSKDFFISMKEKLSLSPSSSKVKSSSSSTSPSTSSSSSSSAVASESSGSSSRTSAASSSSSSGDDQCCSGVNSNGSKKGENRRCRSRKKRDQEVEDGKVKRRISLDNLGSLLKKMTVSKDGEGAKEKKAKAKARTIWRSPTMYRRRNESIRRKIVCVSDVYNDSTEQYIRLVFLDKY